MDPRATFSPRLRFGSCTRTRRPLRSADERGELRPPTLEAQPYLYKGNNPNTQIPIHGMYTVADAVQAVLAHHGHRPGTGSDEDVR